MASVFQINEEHQIVCIVEWGTLTFAGIINHRKTVTEDPRFKPGFKALVDFTRCAAVHLSADDIQQLARPHQYNRQSRRAFVACSEVIFGSARMFEAYADLSGSASNLLICRTMEEAIAWVEVPEKVIQDMLAELLLKIPDSA